MTHTAFYANIMLVTLLDLGWKHNLLFGLGWTKMVKNMEVSTKELDDCSINARFEHSSIWLLPSAGFKMSNLRC